MHNARRYGQKDSTRRHWNKSTLSDNVHHILTFRKDVVSPQCIERNNPHLSTETDKRIGKANEQRGKKAKDKKAVGTDERMGMSREKHQEHNRIKYQGKSYELGQRQDQETKKGQGHRQSQRQKQRQEGDRDKPWILVSSQNTPVIFYGYFPTLKRNATSSR